MTERDWEKDPWGTGGPDPFRAPHYDRPDAAIVNYSGDTMLGTNLAIWLRQGGWSVSNYYVPAKRQRKAAEYDRPEALIILRKGECFVKLGGHQ